MGVVFGSGATIDPAELARSRSLDPHSRHCVTAEWYGRAAHYLCPTGFAPGTGCVLMKQELASQLEPESQYTLTMNDGIREAQFKKMSITRRVVVNPSSRGHECSAVLVHFADRRINANGIVNRRFNVRRCVDPPSYDPNSLDPDSQPWEWDTLIEYLWDRAGNKTGAETTGNLGTVPDLPFAPDGRPEQFAAFGVPATEVLQSIFDLFAWALAYNPISDTFTIVQKDEDSETIAQAEADLDNPGLYACGRWHDLEIKRDRLRAEPDTIRVLFPIYSPQSRRELHEFYEVEIENDGDGTNPVIADTEVFIRDYMPALYSSGGSATGTFDLDARAQEVADQYLRRMRVRAPMQRTYIGFVTDARMFPGQSIDWALWEDFGDDVSGRVAGMKTTFARTGKWEPVPPFSSKQYLLGNCPGSGSGSDSSGSGAGVPVVTSVFCNSDGSLTYTTIGIDSSVVLD